jgi:predicted small lipoprotein YifL
MTLDFAGAWRTAVLTCLLTLASCGQRGPLTLPEPGRPPPADAGQQHSAEEDRDDDER